MNAPAWFSRGVAKLLPAPGPALRAAAVPAERAQAHSGASIAALPAGQTRAQPAGIAPPQPVPAKAARATRERLQAKLRRGTEALSPRRLRHTLAELQAVLDSQVSEVEGGRRACAFAQWYGTLHPEFRRDVWLLMSEQFAPDAGKVRAARDHYDATRDTADAGQGEIGLRQAIASPRTRLLQRFAVFPEGLRFLLDLRTELLAGLASDRRLLALDAELEQLFSTWFDVAFLELRRISWDSPASLLEKLIQYEAVHDIRGWADLKNRLDNDRRCYGFFHPRLPSEPLIFVEVAFSDALARSITPLLDEAAAPFDLQHASSAIFYSISSTQSGLRGVSFGDSLIKRVVETLRAEFPRLKTFATLSPMPGLRAWLKKNAPAMLARIDEKRRTELGRELGADAVTAEFWLKALDGALAAKPRPGAQRLLLQSAAHYLAQALDGGKPLDPVARFHLGNGARVERLNWAADPSAKGQRQSYGMMVNYLYDPKRLDRNRALLAQGKIALSGEIERLQF